LNDTSKKVMDRLAGRKDMTRKRRTIWYSRWGGFADFLDTNPSKRQVIHRVHKLINDISGYRYARIAGASEEALDLVCQERGYK